MNVKRVDSKSEVDKRSKYGKRKLTIECFLVKLLKRHFLGIHGFVVMRVYKV